MGKLFILSRIAKLRMPLEDNKTTEKGETAYELAIGTTALLGNVPSPDLADGYGRLFLRYSQMGELLFDVIRHKIERVPTHIQGAQFQPAAHALHSASSDWGIAGELAHSLEGYPPSEFYRIRPALQGGGGNQSPSFRKVLRTSREAWKAYQAQVESHKLTLVAMHHDPSVREEHGDLYALTQAMLTFDSSYQHFERGHLILIRRIIGQRGLTPLGNDLADLERRLTSPLFPELWGAISPPE